MDHHIHGEVLSVTYLSTWYPTAILKILGPKRLFHTSRFTNKNNSCSYLLFFEEKNARIHNVIMVSRKQQRRVSRKYKAAALSMNASRVQLGYAEIDPAGGTFSNMSSASHVIRKSHSSEAKGAVKM